MCVAGVGIPPKETHILPNLLFRQLLLFGGFQECLTPLRHVQECFILHEELVAQSI